VALVLNGAVVLAAEAVAAVAVLRGYVRLGGGRGDGSAKPARATVGGDASLPSID